jgi:hypothetical protein
MKAGEDSLSESKKRIPAPRSTSATKAALLDDTVSLIEVTVGDASLAYALGRKRLTDGLSKFSAGTLARIAGATEAHCRQVIFCVYDELRKPVPDEGYVNDLLMLSSYFEKKSIGIDPTGNHLIGARACEGLEPLGTDGFYPNERLSQLTALISATDKAVEMVLVEDVDVSILDFSSGYTSAVIADTALRRLIIEATDADRRRIVGIIEERNTVRVGDIKALLESGEASSLSSGAL